METRALCGSLLKWLETFPGREGIAVQQLTDGVVMANVLHQIAPEYFSQFWLAKIKADVGDNWRLKVSNLRKVQQGIVDYYQEQINQSIKHFPLPDLNKIGEHDDQEELGRMLQLILGCAVNCESKQQYIEAIMNMEETVQKVIMEAIQELMLRETSPDIEGRLDLGPASFHPHFKTVREQLEAATQARDEAIQRCHELEHQISVASEEKTALTTENEKLTNRLDALETGVDLGGTSTLRYKDLKKQIDSLQDELYKLETSRDEYRTKFEVLERENQEVQARNEELQQLADEARSLKDEVDALREMSERALVYEGTMETYKKKLEELSDLKRQVRILEEKNSDYMQHNMELEEEVKKSGTWRPQLELYKKQVADLHQQLTDEAKKTDRHIFENKKLAEKMDAIVQEKDRLTLERDSLKENIEELRCHISTLTSDTTSRPPSDLSDVDLLEIVPHEIRQKLIRLQHENTLLKQRAGEGDSSEQLPVLQTLVSDLQERQTSLTQENRWDCKGDFIRHIPSPGGWSPNPGTFPSFSFCVDPSRKRKMFKKNLKWASESDLLIFRQPKGLLSSNFLSSTLPLQQPRSLPPLPVSSASFATQTSKESPIVIRHIHEFKLSPSPTNEDSGCCRTSPSSCEGCDDNGCVEDHSSDFVGTLDSGVSGVYSNTLESGISGVYRCLSPVIPSIVEECTTHHISDIIPALGGQRSNSPPVMHHSHPAHTSCLHCCFQNSSQEMNKEMGSSGIPNVRVSSPCPPRPHTVCSYSPPYKYSHTTSPVSTTPLPNIQVSPSVSPLPNTSVVPLSFCLPSTVVEVSTIQASSGMLSCNKASESLMTSCSLPPISATSLTSLTYVTTSPTPVSLSQTRKTCPSYSRPLIPPDSPTPHNSPRLPNSINATRSRASKSPPVLSTLVTEVAPEPVDLPITPAILVSNAVSSCKELPKGEKVLPKQEKNNFMNSTTVSSPVIDKISDQLKNKTLKECSSSTAADMSTPSSGRSKLEPHKPLQLNMKLPTLLRKTNVQDDSKKDDPFKDVPTSSLLQPVHLTATKFGNEERVQPVTKDSKNIEEKGELKMTGPLNVTKVNNNVKPTVNGFRSGVSYSQYPRKYSPLWRANTPLLTTSNNSNHCNVNHSFSNGISSPSSTSSSASHSNTSTISSSSLVIKADNALRNGKKNSPVISKHGKDNTLQSKGNNHVKFRDPVVSEAFQRNQDPVPSQYSPASPRERMLSPTHGAALNKSESPSSIKKKQNGITLMSDTLFTHFVVSNSLPYRFERDVASATDTDTDLETLERKLTMGMYAAPLVSSESCTSFSPDDGDEDPSATEYCTDTEEYNPHQYKAFAEENNPAKCSSQALLLNKARSKRHNPKFLSIKALDAAALVNTYSFFRKQSKAKKQRKNSFKELTPTAVSGGIVKPKNKTAKHMVAETFNAMFTLCTP